MKKSTNSHLSGEVPLAEVEFLPLECPSESRGMVSGIHWLRVGVPSCRWLWVNLGCQFGAKWFNRPSYDGVLQSFEPMKKDMPFGEVTSFALSGYVPCKLNLYSFSWQRKSPQFGCCSSSSSSFSSSSSSSFSSSSSSSCCCCCCCCLRFSLFFRLKTLID